MKHTARNLKATVSLMKKPHIRRAASTIANALIAAGSLFAVVAGLGLGVVQNALLYLHLVKLSSIGSFLPASSIGLGFLSSDLWLIVGGISLVVLAAGIAEKWRS